MPLQTTAYANGLKALMEDMFSNPSNLSTADCRTKFANDFATLTETFIKTGQVKAGITLQSTGTAANHTGATTGLGTIE
jgi:hypothetical protein